MGESNIRKQLNLYLLFFAISLSLIVCSCGGGSKNTTPFNITGSWFIYQTTTGRTGVEGPDIFKLTQSDDQISGTTPEGKDISGSVDDMSVTISWTDSDKIHHTLTGDENSDASTITGTWKSSDGKSGQWHGLFKTTTITDITGSWDLFETIESNEEQDQGIFALTQNENSISGTTPQGQEVIGTTSDVNIIFFFTGVDGATYTLRGTINVENKKRMSGTLTNSNGQSGTWRAVKSD